MMRGDSTYHIVTYEPISTLETHRRLKDDAASHKSRRSRFPAFQARRSRNERYDPHAPRVSVSDAARGRSSARSRARRALAAHAAPFRARPHQPLASLRWGWLDADRLRLWRRAHPRLL